MPCNSLYIACENCTECTLPFLMEFARISGGQNILYTTTTGLHNKMWYTWQSQHDFEYTDRKVDRSCLSRVSLQGLTSTIGGGGWTCCGKKASLIFFRALLKVPDRSHTQRNKRTRKRAPGLVRENACTTEHATLPVPLRRFRQ